eukprot:scaffold150571_cov35-Tisochrysis_lutea.AAC.3
MAISCKRRAPRPTSVGGGTGTSTFWGASATMVIIGRRSVVSPSVRPARNGMCSGKTCSGKACSGKMCSGVSKC